MYLIEDTEVLCKNPKVSIICLVYNHEKYLRTALEGFVSQATDFEYEVVIHDDASTDNSLEIIKEYVHKYPNIFRVIVQTENQYSKKDGNIMGKFIMPLLRGEYIAYCEGDDFWMSENRLCKQVDFLDRHPDYIACCGDYIRKDMVSGKEVLIRGLKESKDMDTKKLINWGWGRNQETIHLSTLMHRREYKKFNLSGYVGGGDIKLAYELISQGRIYTFKDCFSTYRYKSCDTSWTVACYADSGYRKHQMTSLSLLYKCFDDETSGDFHDEIMQRIRVVEYEYYKSVYDVKKIFEDYKDIWSNEQIIPRVGIFLKFYFPALYDLLKKIFF